LREDLRPGLRQVTKHRAVFYFTVDEAAERVRVLAVFFGGQDHLGLMLRRLGRACG
jgi:plasmid stabilization system protein ParE